jgi:hypothetical protein
MRNIMTYFSGIIGEICIRNLEPQLLKHSLEGRTTISSPTFVDDIYISYIQNKITLESVLEACKEQLNSHYRRNEINIVPGLKHFK